MPTHKQQFSAAATKYLRQTLISVGSDNTRHGHLPLLALWMWKLCCPPPFPASSKKNWINTRGNCCSWNMWRTVCCNDGRWGRGQDSSLAKQLGHGVRSFLDHVSTAWRLSDQCAFTTLGFYQVHVTISVFFMNVKEHVCTHLTHLRQNRMVMCGII